MVMNKIQMEDFKPPMVLKYFDDIKIIKSLI
jgi:hypothetical protein